MILTVLSSVLIGQTASANLCRQYLEHARGNLRRSFNQRVIGEHMRRSRESFAHGFEATKRDLDFSRRFHQVVTLLDHERPGWDVDDSVDLIATAEPLPLIGDGVIPRVYPPHTVVLIEHDTFVPLVAIRIDGERPDLIRLMH